MKTKPSCPHCGRDLEGRELKTGVCSSDDCPRHDVGFFFVEITDTFGGEANYCWVQRLKVKASTFRGAIIKAARHAGYSGRIHKTADYGDMTRHDVRGAAVCIFTSWFDPANHGEYSRIETI